MSLLSTPSFDIGSPIGSFMGGINEGKGPTVQSGTTLAAPWKAQQPYLKNLFSTAEQLSNKPLEYYPSETVTGFTPEQKWAQSRATSRALNGSPLLDQAQNEVLSTLQGKYLDPNSNPWLKATYERALEDAMPGFRGSAISAGRYGSGMENLLEGRLKADLATGIYGGAYESERNRMTNAINNVIPLSQADYYDIGQLAAVGEEKQSMEQARRDAEMAKFNFMQMEPWTRAGMYSNLITGDFGGITSSDTERQK